MKTILFPLFLLISFVNVSAAGSVMTLRVPDGGLVPEVILDPKGVIHMTYGLSGNGFYMRSTDNGKGFTKPVQINHRAGTVKAGGERGIKLARGKDGVLHISWLGPKKEDGIWYTRSENNGQSFEAERNLHKGNSLADGVSTAADKDGNVIVFWLDSRKGKDPNSPYSFAIYMSQSKDNGKTFGENIEIRHDHPGLACECCRLESRIGDDGNVYLAFRSGYKSIRDIYLLKGPKKENNFRSTRVSTDDWNLDACPHSGASLQIDPKGKVVVSWMSVDKVYWSRSENRLKSFAPRVQVAAGKVAQNHPTAVMNGKGQTLLVWKEGSEVKWAKFNADMKPDGETMVAGTFTGRTKPTALVGRDDNFYIIF
jgi:hypothetical protein